MPFAVNSNMQPRFSFSGPDTVPLAIKSPGRIRHPFDVWCATIWPSVQYISANEARL